MNFSVERNSVNCAFKLLHELCPEKYTFEKFSEIDIDFISVRASQLNP